MTTKLLYGIAVLSLLTLALYFGLVAMSPETSLVKPTAVVSLTTNSSLETETKPISPTIDSGVRPTKKIRPRMSDQITPVTGSQPDIVVKSNSAAQRSLRIEKALQANERKLAFGNVRNELNHVMRNGMGQIDINELDQVLETLQGLSEADGTVSGVNISPLRNNLAVVAKINQVNAKIKLEAEKIDNQDWSKLNAYVAELQNLQGQIQTVGVDAKSAATDGQP